MDLDFAPLTGALGRLRVAAAPVFLAVFACVRAAPFFGLGRRAVFLAAVERLAGRLKAAVDFGQIDDLMSGGIATFLADITKQCEQIHKALYSAYITYGAETVL